MGDGLIMSGTHTNDCPSFFQVVKPIVMVVNYSALGIAFDVDNLFYSADVMGSVERQVAQQFDTPVMVMSAQSEVMRLIGRLRNLIKK